MKVNEAIAQLNYDKDMILFNPNSGETYSLEYVKALNEDNYRTYIADCMAIEALDKTRWIPVNERMPEERMSVFAKFKGTTDWNNAMFETMSNEVIVTVEFENGERRTMTMYTTDGEWRFPISSLKRKVIAWMPLPEAYEEVKE